MSMSLQVCKAALLLSDWVVQNARSVCNQHVLELGAGVAMPSIVAALCGASCVATDNNMEALEFAQRNVRANQRAISCSGGNVTTGLLDWSTDICNASSHLKDTFDSASNPDGCTEAMLHRCTVRDCKSEVALLQRCVTYEAPL